jgi:hypothetical protein
VPCRNSTVSRYPGRRAQSPTRVDPSLTAPSPRRHTSPKPSPIPSTTLSAGQYSTENNTASCDPAWFFSFFPHGGNHPLNFVAKSVPIDEHVPAIIAQNGAPATQIAGISGVSWLAAVGFFVPPPQAADHRGCGRSDVSGISMITLTPRRRDCRPRAAGSSRLI